MLKWIKTKLAPAILILLCVVNADHIFEYVTQSAKKIESGLTKRKLQNGLRNTAKLDKLLPIVNQCVPNIAELERVESTLSINDEADEGILLTEFSIRGRQQNKPNNIEITVSSRSAPSFDGIIRSQPWSTSWSANELRYKFNPQVKTIIGKVEACHQQAVDRVFSKQLANN